MKTFLRVCRVVAVLVYVFGTYGLATGGSVLCIALILSAWLRQRPQKPPETVPCVRQRERAYICEAPDGTPVYSQECVWR